jgi:hypothetical protein
LILGPVLLFSKLFCQKIGIFDSKRQIVFSETSLKHIFDKKFPANVRQKFFEQIYDKKFEIDDEAEGQILPD